MASNDIETAATEMDTYICTIGISFVKQCARVYVCCCNLHSNKLGSSERGQVTEYSNILPMIIDLKKKTKRKQCAIQSRKK